MVIVLQIAETTEVQMTPARERLPEGVKKVVLHIAAFLGGLLLSSVQAGNGISPFGVCFLAAVPPRYIFSAGTGAAAGYLLTQESMPALRYVAALLSAGVLSRLSCEFEKIRSFKLLPACIACLVCFLTGMAASLPEALTLQGFLLVLGESAAAFAMAYFLATGLCTAQLWRQDGLSDVRALPGVCVSLFLLLLSVADIALFGVSFARIATVYLLLLFARLYRETGGAIAGLAAAGVFLMDGALGLAAFAYGAAGFCVGMFAHAKRYVGACVLLAAYAAAILFTGGGVRPLIEAGLAALLFLATPQTLLRKVERVTAATVLGAQENPQRREILTRLRETTQAVDEMSQSVKKVSALLQSPTVGETETVYARVREEVCTSCGRQALCWEKNSHDTLHAFAQMHQMLTNHMPLHPTSVPPVLAGRCIRLTTLTESFGRGYIRSVERSAAQMKINEVRQVTAEQFDSLCDILRDFSAELSTELCFDETAAGRVRACLQSTFGFSAAAVSCVYNAENRLRLQLEFADGQALPPKTELHEALEQALARPLELPDMHTHGTTVQMTFCERNVYRVEAAAAKITADNERLCGDSYESFYDGRGHYIVILSDGMGQGARAAVDSTMAATLTAKLVKAGAGFHSALKMVNAALMLKSGEESLATLDILSVDLYAGQGRFYKAGAAKSLICRGHQCQEIKRASLPAGILKEARFATVEGALADGDLVVLASDGAFDGDDAVFRRILAAAEEKPCAEIAKSLADAAAARTASAHRDDITVIAVRIRKNPEE